MVMPTKMMNVTSGFAKAIAARFGGDGALSRVGGERDATFLIEHTTNPRVLKFVAEGEAKRVAAQIAALRHLERVDPTLPVPRVCRTLEGLDWVDIGDGTVAWMVTFTRGATLDRCDVTDAILAGLGQTAARLVVALADFRYEPLDDPAEWNVARIGELRAFASYVEDARARLLVERAFDSIAGDIANNWRGLPRQVIHGDLNPFNLVVRNGCIAGVIDFGDMHVGLRVAEIGIAAAYHLAGRFGIGSLVASYAKRMPLTRDERRALPSVVAARLATTVLVTAKNVRARPHDAGYVLRNVPAAVNGLERLLGNAGSDVRAVFEE